MEKTRTARVFFAYLGRREVRYIRNEAGVIPLTCLLCVYPHLKDERPYANTVAHKVRPYANPVAHKVRLYTNTVAHEVRPYTQSGLRVGAHLVCDRSG